MSIQKYQIHLVVLAAMLLSTTVGCKGFHIVYDAPAVSFGKQQQYVESSMPVEHNVVTSAPVEVHSAPPAQQAMLQPQPQMPVTPQMPMPAQPQMQTQNSPQQQPGQNAIQSHAMTQQIGATQQPMTMTPAPVPNAIIMRLDELRSENKNLLDRLAESERAKKEGLKSQQQIDQMNEEIRRTRSELADWQDAIKTLKSAVVKQENEQLQSLDGVASSLEDLIDSHRQNLSRIDQIDTTAEPHFETNPRPAPPQDPIMPVPDGLEVPPANMEALPMETSTGPQLQRISHSVSRPVPSQSPRTPQRLRTPSTAERINAQSTPKYSSERWHSPR